VGLYARNDAAIVNAGELPPAPANATQYPWAPEKTIEIWRAFGPRKRKNQPEQILKFIILCSLYKMHFDRDTDDVHPAAVNLEIANLRAAASSMASAIASLTARARNRVILSGVEYGKWISPNARQDIPQDNRESVRLRQQNLRDYFTERMHPPGTDRPIWNDQNLDLDRLEHYARELALDAKRALDASPVTRGTHRQNTKAAELANDLYRCWLIVFAERGSLQPGREFHKVAAAVANLFGLKIGPRILRRASYVVDVELSLLTRSSPKQ